jgi:hypothetical protein
MLRLETQCARHSRELHTPESEKKKRSFSVQM